MCRMKLFVSIIFFILFVIMYHTTIEDNQEIIQSAWGIVYYLHDTKYVRILLLKRQSMAGRIERVSPKGKVYAHEAIEAAAIREVSEETGIAADALQIVAYAWSIHIRSKENPFGTIDKDMNYYLMEYTGDPSIIIVPEWEWFMGEFKRYTMKEVFDIIHFVDMKKIMLHVYQLLQKREDIVI